MRDDGEVEEAADRQVPSVSERRVRVMASVREKRRRGAGSVCAGPMCGCAGFCWAAVMQCRCCWAKCGRGARPTGPEEREKSFFLFYFVFKTKFNYEPNRVSNKLFNLTKSEKF